MARVAARIRSEAAFSLCGPAGAFGLAVNDGAAGATPICIAGRAAYAAPLQCARLPPPSFTAEPQAMARVAARIRSEAAFSLAAQPAASAWR
jgi:hypothetical protein